MTENTTAFSPPQKVGIRVKITKYWQARENRYAERDTMELARSRRILPILEIKSIATRSVTVHNEIS